MKVLELMKVHVIRAAWDATLGDAVDMMDLYQITTLPVVDEHDRLIGIVSESDIVHRLLPGVIRGGEIQLTRETALASLMVRDVVSVDEGEDVAAAAKLMMDRELKRLPVTGAGRLVGTIARIDICQAFLEGELISASESAGSL